MDGNISSYAVMGHVSGEWRSVLYSDGLGATVYFTETWPTSAYNKDDLKIVATASIVDNGQVLSYKATYTNTSKATMSFVPWIGNDTMVNSDDASVNTPNATHTKLTMVGSEYTEEQFKEIDEKRKQGVAPKDIPMPTPVSVVQFILTGSDGIFIVPADYDDLDEYDDPREIPEAPVVPAPTNLEEYNKTSVDSAFVAYWDEVVLYPGESTTIVLKSSITDVPDEPEPEPEQPQSEPQDPQPITTGTYGAPVTNGQWNCGPNGIWTYRTNGAFRNTWGYIANPFAKEGQNTADWFYFNANGAMVTGWQQINGKWYYFNEAADGTRGAMKTGWIQWEGNWYYLTETKDENGGALLVSTTTPDGHVVDETGKRVR